MADPGPLAIFCFWGIVLLSCSSFLVYKKMRTARGSSYLRLERHSITAKPRRSSPNDSSPEEVSPKERLTEELHLNVRNEQSMR